MTNLEISKLFSVEGMVAVVTGGGTGKFVILLPLGPVYRSDRWLTGKSPGLGLTMAQALDANGAAKVFIIGRREHKLKAAAASAKNGSIVPVVADVSCKESLQNAYSQVAASAGHIDLLIANSGVMGPPGAPEKPKGEKPTLGELRDHLWSIPMEDFTNASHVNVTGAFYTAVAFLPLLEEANKRRPAFAGPNVPRPQIIVTTSIAGFMRPAASYAYNTSKAGANHLVKVLSTKLSEYDIRVNGIAPGLYHSEMSEERYQKEGIANKGLEDGSFERSVIPLTRSGSEEDIAGIILWLGGKSGSYINGSLIATDGGRMGVHPASY